MSARSGEAELTESEAMESPIGRSRTVSDPLDPKRAQALHATLAKRSSPPGSGDPLPAFWHQIYFWDVLPANELGSDGHEKTGGFIPDFGLEQRMWAGGRLRIERPLRLGIEARKTSTIESVAEKNGKSGPLVFVTVRHELSQGGSLALVEYQDLVYRNSGGSPDKKFSTEIADHRRSADFDPILLFRYSALTFNGHRIHYDSDYCRNMAGYPGLVVHGPLLATLLVDEAESRLKQMREFEYRAIAPTFCGESVEICSRQTADGQSLWIQDQEGGLRMTAVAREA